ncbi:hypothetical protein NEOKW01_0046 [Nematocida sp. AWRm80]|nr:hypothetical protein NEOKW01_0046 [Nematocida sp. AWRm80]
MVKNNRNNICNRQEIENAVRKCADQYKNNPILGSFLSNLKNELASCDPMTYFSPFLKKQYPETYGWAIGNWAGIISSLGESKSFTENTFNTECSKITTSINSSIVSLNSPSSIDPADTITDDVITHITNIFFSYQDISDKKISLSDENYRNILKRLDIFTGTSPLAKNVLKSRIKRITKKKPIESKDIKNPLTYEFTLKWINDPEVCLEERIETLLKTVNDKDMHKYVEIETSPNYRELITILELYNKLSCIEYIQAPILADSPTTWTNRYHVNPYAYMSNNNIQECIQDINSRTSKTDYKYEHDIISERDKEDYIQNQVYYNQSLKDTPTDYKTRLITNRMNSRLSKYTRGLTTNMLFAKHYTVLIVFILLVGLLIFFSCFILFNYSSTLSHPPTLY